MAFCNWTVISIVLAVIYIGFAIKNLYSLMNPLDGVEITTDMITMDPLWAENEKFNVICFISQSPRFNGFRVSKIRESGLMIFEQEGLRFKKDQPEIVVEVVLNRSRSDSVAAQIQDPSSPVQVPIKSKQLWKALHSNQSNVYLHAFIHRGVAIDDVTNMHLRNGTVLYGIVGLVKYDKIPKSFRHRFLLSDFGWATIAEEDALKANMDPETIISYWKPEVAIKLVTDFTKYPEYHVPAAIEANTVESSASSRNQRRRRKQYKPPIHVDEIGLTSDKYIPLNKTVISLPLKLSYSSMSLQRWLLMANMENSLAEQKNIGFNDKDIDDVRRLIADTSVYLLGITIFASLLHLLFEFLAFQSDITFWKENKSLAGLSARAVVSELFSQCIVFLFLVDSDTSLLVTIPSFFGILIQAWKVQKATGLRVYKVPKGFGLFFGYSIECSRWRKDLPKASADSVSVESKQAEQQSSSTAPISSTSAAPKSNDDVKDGVATVNLDSCEVKCIDLKGSNTPSDSVGSANVSEVERVAGISEDELTRVTLEADRVATSQLGLVLFPVAVGFTLRTLIADKHATWYSWGIGALTGCVYTFGFVLMCPQLFINHKLKSVAFLPWKFLIFRFLNTFIDDLFAFIIKMPTMHRLSVFRDDIVFLIYMYQRWIYRVDESRPVEK